MSYSIGAIEDIDPDEAKALKAVGIRTTEKLLEAAKNPKGRKSLAAKAELDEKKLLRWANIADKLRIKGMGSEKAKLLRRAGVTTPSAMSAVSQRERSWSSRRNSRPCASVVLGVHAGS